MAGGDHPDALRSESDRLQRLEDSANYGLGANAVMAQAFVRLHASMIPPGRVLELGPAEGFGTDVLVELGYEVSCVEGSEGLAAALRARHPDIDVINCLFEDYAPHGKFSCVVMGHVLEHVINPEELLARATRWLEPGGVILAGVPNARSLHRQIGVALGMISHERQLDASDLRVGHRRVYDWDSFRDLISSVGLICLHEGGFWLKLTPNSVLDALPQEVLWQHMRLGMDFPEVAAEIVVVARLPE